jgi:hypothetical protein
MAASVPEIVMDPLLAEYCGEGPITADKLLRSIDAAETIVAACTEAPELPAIEHGRGQLAEIRSELEASNITSAVVRHAAQRLDFQYRNNLWKPLRAYGQERQSDTN